MCSLSSPIRALFFAAALVLGAAAGCDDQSKNPDEGGNLCSEYKTCNDCIAGQQTKGKTEGEAEAQCGAAVVGCWTTWDKPIVCGDKEMKKDEAEG